MVKKKSPETVRAGEFVDTAGQVLGAHEGHQNFTIGQRKGVGLAFGYPIYVTGIDPASNQVTLGKKEELLHRQLKAREVNWITGDTTHGGPREATRCRAKIRYNSEPAPATALLTDKDELLVRFDEPILAITPGQAVVCYEANGDRVLGGGWIDEVAE